MEPTIGEITLFAGNFAPRGWAFCDGQLLAINSFQSLFSILGTTYGGDGRTTFALPDLRGRAPVSPGHGNGLSNYSLGQKDGLPSVTMTSANLPAHSHQVDLQGSLLMPTGNSADTDDPSGAYPGQSSQNIYSTNKSTAAMANMEGQLSVQLQNNGGQQPIDNYQPSLVMHYIIALQGIFPSRS